MDAAPPVCPVSVAAMAYPFLTATARACCPRLPAYAPLPAVWYLPFQPSIGIHNSILMSESALGASVAAMRQNAGTSAYGLAAAPPRPSRPPRPLAGGGGVKAPAPTVR